MTTKVRYLRPKVYSGGGVKSNYWDYLAGAAYFLTAALGTEEGKQEANRRWIGEMMERIRNEIPKKADSSVKSKI